MTWESFIDTVGKGWHVEYHGWDEDRNMPAEAQEGTLTTNFTYARGLIKFWAKWDHLQEGEEGEGELMDFLDVERMHLKDFSDENKTRYMVYNQYEVWHFTP